VTRSGLWRYFALGVELSPVLDELPQHRETPGEAAKVESGVAKLHAAVR
jgi:hypothetical protein